MASEDGHLHLSCERSEFEEGETQSDDSSNENVTYNHISLYHMRQKEKKKKKKKRENPKLTTTTTTTKNEKRKKTKKNEKTTTTKNGENTTFEEKGEPKRIRTEVPLLTSLTPYR